MKKFLLPAVGVIGVLSGSLCTFAETTDTDIEPSFVTVNYLKEDHPSATVKYINGKVASATVGYIKTELPSATVHFNEEKAFRRRKANKKIEDELLSGTAVAVDKTESGAAVVAD